MRFRANTKPAMLPHRKERVKFPQSMHSAIKRCSSSGVVDFDPPVNESVEPNVYGTQHLIELVKLLDAKLVHVSTSYVAGKKDGRVSEDIAIDGYFPEREIRPNEHFEVATELAWYEK